MSLSIYPSISSIFPVFCHGVTRFLHHYPYVTSVCLTLTQIHLPQSLPLHSINGFARFFHGFISVLLLHSDHTSKPQFFHCFSIPSISILLLLLYLASFSKRSTQMFHCFPIVLCDIPSFFPLFFSSFSPPLQSPQVQIGGRTRGQSIPYRHPINTWYITLKKFTCVRLFYHLIS